MLSKIPCGQNALAGQHFTFSSNHGIGEKTAESTPSSWPLSVRRHCPVALLQIFAVSSRDAVSTEAPSVLKTAESTKAP